nr:ATP-dependent 6-phosphofructokinase 7-like [Arachis hypogaea]
MAITLKYIDPTNMIRAIPSNASDNMYCALFAQNVVHGAMADYTSHTSGLRINKNRNHVEITDRICATLLSSMNQPNFLGNKCHNEDNIEE